MRQLTSTIKASTKSETFGLRILSTLIAFLFLPYFLIAQENPWNAPSTPNPWATAPVKIDSNETSAPTNQMRSFYWKGDTVLCDGSSYSMLTSLPA